MSFTSEKFIIDGIRSEDIGVNSCILVRTDSEINRPIMGERDIKEEYIPYKNSPTFYGTQSKNIEFNLKFSLLEDEFTPDVLFELGMIFGKNRYVSFQSCDYLGVQFYVMAKSINYISYGTYKGWWEISLHTSSPYALSLPQISEFDFSDLTTTQTFEIDAKFNVPDPLYGLFVFPKVKIELKGSSTSVTLKNYSDMGRTFSLSSLTALETLDCDCELRKIVSSTGNNRIDNLVNHLWFRLVYGINRITIDKPCILTIEAQYPIYI